MADSTAYSVNRFSNERTIAQKLMKDPEFAKAPADVQKAISDTAMTGTSTVPFDQVMQSAKDAGLHYENSPWWMGLLAMVGTMAGGTAIAQGLGLGTTAAPALEGGTTIGTNLGAATTLPAVTAPGGALATAPALEGGTTLASNLGSSSALPSSGGSGGILSKVGDFLKGKTGDILDMAGKSIGAATDAAGKNRITEAELNMRGNNLYENQLNQRTDQDTKQRNQALDNVYRNSWYDNRQASPYNTRGVTPISDQFATTLDQLAQQGADKLSHVSQYDSDVVKPLAPYTPTKKGLLEEVGTWASPILSGLGSLGKILKK